MTFPAMLGQVRWCPKRSARTRHMSALLEVHITHGSVEAFTQHLHHVLKVAVVPHQRKSHIARAADHLAGQGQWVLRRREAPVDEISRVALVPEQLHGEAMDGRLVEKLLPM